MSMFFNTLKMALRSILSNKMRSFLTMLGIIIGCLAVIMLVSIAQSATGSITTSISSVGADLLTISITDADYALTVEEFTALENMEGVAAVAPYISANGTARSGSSYVNASILGVTPEFISVSGTSLQSGRNIAPSDDEWRTPVAVVGTAIAENLFKSYDVIGESFTLSNRTFLIVGLLSSSGSTTTDSRVLVSMSTAKRVADSGDVTNCYVQAESAEIVEEVQGRVEAYLYSLTGNEDVYDVFDQSSLRDALDDVLSTMSLLLGGISAISLLVGGIGIMNIMLVSVAERTREIGIRKAIGARRSDILTQFLIESCLLSLMGGAIGIGLSALGLKIFTAVSDMAVSMEWTAAAAALVFCVIIGVGFGSYPAAKAAALLPIDALQRR